VEIVERRVEIPVTVEKKISRRRAVGAWTPVLAELARQLDTGRIYDKDVAAVVAAIDVVCKSAERRIRLRRPQRESPVRW